MLDTLLKVLPVTPTYAYTNLTVDADGCDAAVTAIRINPKGIFAADSPANTTFTLSFKVRIK